MRTIAKLFGRSPFVPLQIHMTKVSECVDRIKPAFEAYLAGDEDKVTSYSKKISELEHQADQIKHDIQSQLPRGMFLPVDRERLLEILSIQDNVADKAENLSVLLALKMTPVPRNMRDLIQEFLEKNLEAFEATKEIVEELDELVSAGFGGIEAQRVRQMVMRVARLEFEADEIQHKLLKILFQNEDQLSVADFFLWDKVLKQLSELSNLSERLAHRIQRTLELK